MLMTGDVIYGSSSMLSVPDLKLITCNVIMPSTKLVPLHQYEYSKSAPLLARLELLERKAEFASTCAFLAKVFLVSKTRQVSATGCMPGNIKVHTYART